MGGDWTDEYNDTSWIPLISSITGGIILIMLIVMISCYCCAGCAVYKRRRNMQQLNGVTTVTHTGYGPGGWGREQMIVVHQANPQTQTDPRQPPPPYFANPQTQSDPRQPPPSYFANPSYNPAYPGQPPPIGFQGQPGVHQGQDYPQQQRQFMKPHTEPRRY